MTQSLNPSLNPSSTQSLTRTLAGLVLNTPATDLCAPLLGAARWAVIDTIGCALAGVSEPASVLALRWTDELGANRQSTVWGAATMSSAADTAFVNGVRSHALDFDDAMPTLRGHPSTTLVPALLAVAEARHVPGREVLAAYVLGLEVAGKLGTAVGAGHYLRGWHTTATIGVLSSTAALARLLHFDVERLCIAWALAASQAAGLVKNFGSMAKPFHAGQAARAAVLSCWMAEHGFTASSAIFDGDDGFLSTYGGEDGLPAQAWLSRFGAPWEIQTPGVFVKRWPCCYANHRALGGIFSLVEQHAIGVEDVMSVQVGFLPGADAALLSTDPRTALEGKFSIEYCAAAALLDGQIGLDSFTDAMVMRDPIRTLMQRVHRLSLPGDGQIYSGLKGYTDVTITTSQGSFTTRVDKTPGSPAWPLSDAERQAKFLNCAEQALEPAAARTLLDSLLALEAADDVATVVRLAAGT